MTITKKDITLEEMGEKGLVREILSSLTPSDHLIDGFGHDAAFVDFQINENEVLVINTDRSGLNLAYQLGLAGPECVGDLGVSHAVSDIVAAGGNPKTVSVALLLPSDTQIDFVKRLMLGAENAAKRYGAILTGGDTKKNPKFAMVVTATGVADKEKRLLRSGAKKEDLLVVTGYLGSLLLGYISNKQKLTHPENIRKKLDSALTNQHPPYQLGRTISFAGIANACIDISDGFPSAVYSLCTSSGLGAIIDETRIPIDRELLPLSQKLQLRPMQLSLAGGDWQFLYSIPEKNISQALEIAQSIGANLSVIGRTTENQKIISKTIEGNYRVLRRIENDSFSSRFLSGKGYFSSLSEPVECFDEIINYRDDLNDKYTYKF